MSIAKETCSSRMTLAASNVTDDRESVFNDELVANKLKPSQQVSPVKRKAIDAELNIPGDDDESGISSCGSNEEELMPPTKKRLTSVASKQIEKEREENCTTCCMDNPLNTLSTEEVLDNYKSSSDSCDLLCTNNKNDDCDATSPLSNKEESSLASFLSSYDSDLDTPPKLKNKNAASNGFLEGSESPVIEEDKEVEKETGENVDLLKSFSSSFNDSGCNLVTPKPESKSPSSKSAKAKYAAKKFLDFSTQLSSTSSVSSKKSSSLCNSST